MDECSLLRAKLNREKEARKQAEALLEQKSLELYGVNQSLEQRVQARTVQLQETIERLQLAMHLAESAVKASQKYLKF